MLWDQFHSIRYPPAYFPRDDLQVGLHPAGRKGGEEGRCLDVGHALPAILFLGQADARPDGACARLPGAAGAPGLLCRLAPPPELRGCCTPAPPPRPQVRHDILDWHGDHPHTNFHDMYDMLRWARRRLGNP